jgi:hypothetical protein
MPCARRESLARRLRDCLQKPWIKYKFLGLWYVSSYSSQKRKMIYALTYTSYL